MLLLVDGWMEHGANKKIILYDFYILKKKKQENILELNNLDLSSGLHFRVK